MTDLATEVLALRDQTDKMIRECPGDMRELVYARRQAFNEVIALIRQGALDEINDLLAMTPVHVVMAGTGQGGGADTVVAVATTKVVAQVLADKVYWGYVEDVPLLKTTSSAHKVASSWTR